MLRDFDDSRTRWPRTSRPLLDTTGGMVAERMRSGMPWVVAALALLSVVLFLVLNHRRGVPTRSGVLGGSSRGEHTSPQEVVVLCWVALGLLVVGAVVALLSLRRVRGWAMVPNIVVAVLLLTAFV